MTNPIPKLRHQVDCVSTIQPRIDGHSMPWSFVVDYITGYRAAVNADEGEIIRAMRRINRETSVEELQREIRRRAGFEVSEQTITAAVAHLTRQAMTGTESDAATIRRQQLAGRREAHSRQQLAALEHCLERLASEIPYYQPILADRPQPAADTAILRSMPIMTKALLRTNFHRLQPPWFSKDKCQVRFMSSSGSTDSRTQTVHLSDELNKGYELGFSALGLNPTVDSFRIAYLIPPICSGTECHMDMKLPYEKRLHPGGRLLHLNSVRDPSTADPALLDAVIDEMIAFHPTMVAVDAAYLAAVARRLVATGRRCPSVKAIVTSYGLTSAIHLHVIAKAFGCAIHDLYSMAETGPIAGSCANGPYHVLETHLVEIMNGDQPAAAGEVGKVLVTTLENKLTPLLRYETGDLGRASHGPCECSMAHSDTFLHIEGRIHDLITDVRGERLTPRDVDRAVATPNILEAVNYYQLVQREPRSYQLTVVAGEGWNSGSETQLKDQLHELLGRDASVTIERKASVPPAPNGKYRLCYRQQ